VPATGPHGRSALRALTGRPTPGSVPSRSAGVRSRRQAAVVHPSCAMAVAAKSCAAARSGTALSHAPLWMIARWKSPRAAGAASCAHTARAPPD
jgi:hypothetical protein